MCYDIAFKVRLEEIGDYFPDLIIDNQLEIDWPEFDHRQGVSVFAPHPIIYINREDSKPHLRWMEWGCIEFYAKEEPNWKKRNGMLNARSERILNDTKSYWNKIRNRRCLVPLSGTYEHREIVGWKKKLPYLIKPKGQELFFLPGLYSVTELPDKETGELIKRWSFTIITTAANDVMRSIHNSGDNPHRMPLFLPFDMLKEFLSNELTEERYREILAYQIPGEQLDYYPVDTIRTAKPRKDGKSKDERYDWEGKIPPLGTMNPQVNQWLND